MYLKEFTAMGEVGIPILVVIEGDNCCLLLVGQGMCRFTPGVAMEETALPLLPVSG